MKPKAANLALFLVLAATDLGAAQQESSIVYAVTGSREYDGFGSSLAPMGDVDGDGAPDFAVGAIQTFFSPEATGYVQLISGKTGSVLRTWRGERQAQEFGLSLSAFQDLDGDGKKDVAIADDGDMVHIYSSGSGDLIEEFNIKKDLGSIGVNISNFPDINNDGTGDLLVGQPGQGSTSVGRVSIYSGKDGTLVWEVMGRFKSGLLGMSIVEIGDIDGDGLNDLAAGESHGWYSAFEHMPGTVYILSGVDGKEIRQLGNDPDLPFFGATMANLGDLDGDGRPEIAIGAPGYTMGRNFDIGWVGIYSTRTFELLRSFKGIDGQIGLFLGDQLGIAISSAGDVDSDGVPDFLLGTSRFGTSPGRSHWGRIELRSGKSGNLLTAYEGFQEDLHFVSALAPLGDVDGDGRSEFLIGSADFPPPHGSGQVILVRYRPELPVFIRGDGNRDGRVNIADAVFMIGVAYFGWPPGPCLLALDSNGDNAFNPYDFLWILSYLFEGGYAPASPFPECSRYGGFQDLNFDCQASTCSSGQ